MSLASKISALAQRVATEFNALRSQKQDSLVSGTNIKTVNGSSLLGSGDITIQGGGGLGAPITVVPTAGTHVIDASLGKYFKLNVVQYTQSYQQQATIAYVGGSSINAGSSTSVFVTPSATGMQAGDLILLFVSSNGSMANIPTGYTEVTRTTYGTVRSMVCYKFATGSTESSVNITGISVSTAISWTVYRGVDTATPFDATRTIATGSSGMPNPPAITTVTDNTMILAVGSMAASAWTISAPAGYTLRVAYVAGGTAQTLMIAEKFKASIGSDDPASFTGSYSAQWVGITIALRAKWDTIVTELDTCVAITDPIGSDVYEAILDIECASNKLNFPANWTWNYPVNFKNNSGMQIRIVSDNGGTTFKAFAPVSKNAFAPVLLEEYSKNLTIPALNIDWKAGAIFYKTLTTGSTLTFSNLEQGKVITAIINGNYTLALPSVCKILGGEYKGDKTNYIQFMCASSTLVLTVISQEKV